MVLFKSKLILVIALMLSPFSHSQMTFDILNYQKFNLSTLSNNASSLKSCTDKFQTIITTAYHSGKENRSFVHYNRNNEEIKEIHVIKNKSQKFLNSDIIYSMSILDDNLLILGHHYIYHLKINWEKREGVIINYINNFDDNFSHVSTVNGMFFLSVFYNFHPGDAKHKHIWAFYDIESGTIQNKKVHNDKYIEFSYLLNKWFDTFGDNIYFASPIKYEVGIYNTSFQKVDSIYLDELDENIALVDEYVWSEMYTKESITKFKIFDENKLNRIRKIYVLDNSNVLILIKLKKSNLVRIDYWRKSEDQWLKCAETQLETWYTEGSSYSDDDKLQTFSDFYQNAFDLMYIGDNIFELWSYPYFRNIVTPSFNLEHDYFKVRNLQIIENPNEFVKKNILLNCTNCDY